MAGSQVDRRAPFAGPARLALDKVGSMPTSPALRPSVVAVTGLVAGFAVARSGGRRELGGAVFVLAGAWCAGRWWRSLGPMRAIGCGHPLPRGHGRVTPACEEDRGLAIRRRRVSARGDRVGAQRLAAIRTSGGSSLRAEPAVVLRPVSKLAAFANDVVERCAR